MPRLPIFWKSNSFLGRTLQRGATSHIILSCPYVRVWTFSSTCAIFEENPLIVLYLLDWDESCVTSRFSHKISGALPIGHCTKMSFVETFQQHLGLYAKHLESLECSTIIRFFTLINKITTYYSLVRSKCRYSYCYWIIWQTFYCRMHVIHEFHTSEMTILFFVNEWDISLW